MRPVLTTSLAQGFHMSASRTNKLEPSVTIVLMTRLFGTFFLQQRAEIYMIDTLMLHNLVLRWKSIGHYADRAWRRDVTRNKCVSGN